MLFLQCNLKQVSRASRPFDKRLSLPRSPRVARGPMGRCKPSPLERFETETNVKMRERGALLECASRAANIILCQTGRITDIGKRPCEEIATCCLVGGTSAQVR